MQQLTIAGIGLVILIAYLLITGGWDIGENIQFIFVGLLSGILISIFASKLIGG